MQVLSLTPFRVTTLLWEAQPSQCSLTVTVKATFWFVADGEARVADRQELLGGDRFWDERPTASLFAPGDYAPLKRRVDVMLVGHAYAPDAKPVESLVARFTVGDFSKAIRVTGDRLWEPRAGGLVRGEARPFLRLPLRYELAAFAANNPVGIDLGAAPAAGNAALPNLEAVDGGGVVGFGPLAPSWRTRRRLVSDEGMFWAFGVSRGTSNRIEAPPPGFDFSFFNAAPPEQQVDLLRAGTRIELENMSPEHAKLVTRLPAVRPQAFIVRKGVKGAEEIALRVDTLWVDCDRDLLTLTFRGIADAGRGDLDALGTLVVAADPKGKKMRWADVEKSVTEAAPTGIPRRRAAVTVMGIGAGDENAEKDPLAPDPLAVRYDAVLESLPAIPQPEEPSTEPIPADANAASFGEKTMPLEDDDAIDEPTVDRSPGRKP